MSTTVTKTQTPPTTTTATTVTTRTTRTTTTEDTKTIQDQLSLPILLADRILKTAQEADSNKPECADLSSQVAHLSHMLRTAVRFTSSTTTIYDRPLRRIASDVFKNLDRALTLVRRCKRSGGLLHHLFSITTTADFRKVSNLLDGSIADLKWLLSIFDSDGGMNLSLPPIASNDPILAWVWSHISTIQMGQHIKDRVDAANSLASLAKDSDRNKKMIVEEGGVQPLLKLLKEGSSPDVQLAAANALSNLGTDQERVRVIVDSLGVPVIVGVLGDSCTRVQIVVASLVAKMAELDEYAQEEFMRDNVTRPLVSILSRDLMLDVVAGNERDGGARTSIPSLVQMNKEKEANKNAKVGSSNGLNHRTDGSSSLGGVGGGSLCKKEREVETPEDRLNLKVCCSEALWKLSRDGVSSSRKITETKGLLCLAKIIEKEKGVLRFNCLMAIMEITTVAEANADLRRAAFKTNNNAAKAVVDQLLRVMVEESDAMLLIPAVRSIGCLARTFSSKETRVIGPLVVQLGVRDVEVATEAAIALGKFVCPDNFNRSEHSKAIIDFNGVPPLMGLLRCGDRAQIHGLILLCYIALNAGNSKALERASSLNVLESAARSVVAQHPELRDLFSQAMHHLALYHAGAHGHRQSFAP